jgi:hypothetical protein
MTSAQSVEQSNNDETFYIGGRRGGCKGVMFPGESDFVKKFVSVWLHFHFVVTLSLRSNPMP